MIDRKCKLFFGVLFVFLTLYLLRPGNASAADFHNLDLIQPVYHVEINGEDIGTVRHKSSVLQYIHKKIIEAEAGHEGLQFTTAQKVTFQKRKVFRPEIHVQQTMDELKKDLEIKAKAVAMKFGDQQLGYVKNRGNRYTNYSTI